MPRILIVDDEKSIRRTLSEFLRADGYEVEEAEDADSALRLLSRTEFDVVVTDIILPRVNGVELLRRIHALVPHVQVVMMTGEPTVETASASLRAGAADYLFKPINKEAILRVTANAVRIKVLDDARRRLEAENHAHRENLERLVTERTAQLRASEERAQELSRFNQGVLNALSTRICVLAEDGKVLAVNRAWQLFAIAHPHQSATVDVGTNYLAAYAAVTGTDEATAQEAVRGLRAVAQGSRIEFAQEYLCRWSGSPQWFLLRATRFADQGLARVVVAHVDITERRQAEEAVRLAHARLQRIVDSNVVGIVVATADGAVLEANDYCLRLAGYSRKELEEGKLNWRTLTPPEWLAADETAIAELQKRGAYTPFEKEFFRRDGGRVPVLLAGAVMPGPGEQIAAFVLDLTERKHAEERLREQAALLDAANDAIFVHDLNGVVRYWNQGAERLYGVTRAEAEGCPIAGELLPNGSASLSARAALLKKASWSGELEQTSRNGKPLVVFSRWTLLRDHQGEPRRVLVINADLSEKKLLEAQFLRAQRLEGVGSLASGIAHDLNNILTPVLMTAPMLRTAVADTESRAMLDTIESCAQRGADIIRQLLTFARGTPSARVPLPIRHLLREVEKMIRETFPRDIRVRTISPNDVWPLLGDTTQVHQALMNLCVNARDAMPEGGTLTMEAKNIMVDSALADVMPGARPGPCVCVSVADTGTGISPEHLNRIFDPFFTTKEVGRGTGLGLATVLGIVRGHEGFVKVDSQLARGTRFELYFPASPESHEPAAHRSQAASPGGQGELILVVDDEAAVRESLRRVLESRDYRVVTAADGKEGLAAFNRHRPQVRAVLTDIMMPVMNGPAMIQALRAVQPDILVLGMSGLAERGEIKGINKLDFAAFLIKPFASSELLEAIRTALDKSARTAVPETSN